MKKILIYSLFVIGIFILTPNLKVEASVTFDAITTATTTSGTTSKTMSHTGTGSNLTVVMIVSEMGNVVTTSTYAGQTLTLKRTDGPTGDTTYRWIKIFSLENAPSGTQVATTTFASNPFGSSIAIITFNSSGGIGAVGGNDNSPNVASTTITTTRANSILLDSVYTEHNSIATTTEIGQIQRYVSDLFSADADYAQGSTLQTTTVGQYKMGWSKNPATLSQAVVEVLDYIVPSTSPIRQIKGIGISR